TASGHDEQEVTGLTPERVDQSELLLLGPELRGRRLERAAFPHDHPDETGGAELLGPVDERVASCTADAATVRHADALHGVGLEGAELGGREHLAEVFQLEPEAQVGLVAAVALHGVVP